MKKQLAFTLAELLVTIGVIGVVAAITIPSVVSHYRKKALQTALLKTYSELQQIGLQLYSEDFRLSDIETWRTLETKIMPKIKGSNTVFKINNYQIVSGDLRKIYSSGGVHGHDRKSLINQTCDNGNAVYTDAMGRFWLFNDSDKQICVDINGAKGPNAYGYDYFIFYPDKSNNGRIFPHYTDISNEYQITGQQDKDYTYYAVNNIHPSKSGKDYWNDYLKY